MKLQKDKKANKLATSLIILVFLILIVPAAYIAAAYINKWPLFIQNNHTISDDVKQNAPIRDSAPSSTQKNGSNDTYDLPANPLTTSDNVPKNSTLTISMEQFDQKNGYVTSIGKTNSDGTCVFQYTNPDDKPVIQEATSRNNSCKSSVSEVNFSKLGVWNLKVTLYANGQKAEATQDVTIH